MLQAERLSRLTVMGPKTVMRKAINALHELKACHIENHTKKEGDDLDIAAPLDNAEALSSLIVAVRAIQSTLLGYGTGNDAGKKEQMAQDSSVLHQAKNDYSSFLSKAGKDTERLQNQIALQTAKLQAADEQMRLLADEMKQVSGLAPLCIDFSAFTEYASLDYFAGTIEQPELFKDKLKKITSKYRLFLAADDEHRTVMALFISKADAKNISELLSEHKFGVFDLSRISAKKGKPSELLSVLRKQEMQLAKKRAELVSGFRKTVRQWLPYLNAAEAVLDRELEKAEAPLRFASTQSSFVLRGWIPAAKEQEVRKKLNDATSHKVFITAELVRDQHAAEAHTDEAVPVKFNNPRMVRPFEFFMNLYTLPQYREIDPTFFMFLTFPLFYGFMLGDIGYGLVTLLIFLWLRKKVAGEFSKLVNAMIYGSVSSIVFGFLFGEFFGLEEIGHVALPHLISRAHQVNELMILAIIIGIIHVNIGLLIGFYNVWRAHGFVHALTEKFSWMVLQASAAAFALHYTAYNGIIMPLSVPVLLLVVAVIMLYIGEGVKGLIELPSIFTNILSYARLMAVGLASVILAEVVNEFAGQMFHAGIAGILGGTLLLLVGHTINIMLGLISPFLHSTRLHYVEFFTKFYEGGGLAFMPFGVKEEE